jgi:DNA topoisomerase-1
MIILRKGTKDKYWYEDANGTRIKDKKTLEYVDQLRIPPAYNDVMIFYVKSPKILFQGYDAAGRLQQIYSQAHCKAACKKKFQSLIDFGHTLPKIYADCDKYLAAAKQTKNKIISIIIKIISLCYFRVGNAKYVKLYDHHGISTINKSHIKKTPKGIEIKFVGKKGVVNECLITEDKLNKAIESLTAGKKESDPIFIYDENGTKNIISAIEINHWLRQYGSEFTTKMFRNFDANVMFVEFMRKEHSSQDVAPDQLPLTKRKKALVAAMKEVSQEINNTPAICKKAYMSPDLIALYLDHPRKFKTMFLKEGSARQAFINFLKSIN